MNGQWKYTRNEHDCNPSVHNFVGYKAKPNIAGDTSYDGKGKGDVAGNVLHGIDFPFVLVTVDTDIIGHSKR